MAQPALVDAPISAIRSTWRGLVIAPLLRSCALKLQGESEATTRFLDHYCEVMRLRIKYDLTLRSSHEDRAWNDWSSLRLFFDMNIRLALMLTLPTFEEVWAEVGSWLHYIYDGDNPLTEEVVYMMGSETLLHSTLPRFIVLVFEELRAVPQLTYWIDYILRFQPRHFDMPKEQHGKLFTANNREAQVVPSMANAFQLLCSGEPQISAYVQYMGSLAVSVRNWLYDHGPRPNKDDLEAFIESVALNHKDLVSHPFSPYPIQTRKRLAQINIRNATEVYLANFMEISNPDVPHLLVFDHEWHVFRLFTRGVMEKATAEGEQIKGEVQAELDSMGFHAFFDNEAPPTYDWSSELPDVLFPEPDDDENDENDEDDEDELSELEIAELLPDVCFEPIGPERKIEHYAVAVTRASDVAESNCAICIEAMNVGQMQRDDVPVRIKCGHTFHYGCLTTLINGISKFSNLCPNCRYEICEPRKKRLKEEHDLDNALNEIVETAESDGFEVALQRHLQDDEGDVIMTDF